MKKMTVVKIMAGVASVVMLGLILTFATTTAFGSGGSITIDEKPEHKIIVEMHKMANRYIVADEVWGTEEITHKRIQELKTELANLDTVNRGTLVDILDRWDAGLFYTLADDHNALWTMLGGTVGKATGVVADDKLPAWHKGERPITDINVLTQMKLKQNEIERQMYSKK